LIYEKSGFLILIIFILVPVVSAGFIDGLKDLFGGLFGRPGYSPDECVGSRIC
jgi:hypothetical protein